MAMLKLSSEKSNILKNKLNQEHGRLLEGNTEIFIDLILHVTTYGQNLTLFKPISLKNSKKLDYSSDSRTVTKKSQKSVTVRGN